MKITQIVQSGNREQCNLNGILGYEYSFGISSAPDRLGDGFKLRANATEFRFDRIVNGLIGFSLRRQYRTNFRLEFIY